jgi:hypothetical protein
VIQRQEYVRAEREQTFLETVEDTQYQREIINGLAPFFDKKAPEYMLHFYNDDEVVQLRVLKDTERDVEHRMPV